MGRPRFTSAIRSSVHEKTGGRCFHCNAALSADSGDWDIDHYPVVYRDIEDQCWCWPCGTVTDPLDITNLQPSCAKCNRSHKYERKIWCFCGHTQLRIRKTWLWIFSAFVLVFFIGLLVGRLTS